MSNSEFENMENQRIPASLLRGEWLALNKAGRFEEAIAVAKRLERGGEDADVRTYGEALRRVAEIKHECAQEAGAACQRALAAGEPQAAAWIELGEVMLDLDLLEKAGDCFEKAVALNPEAAAAWTGLGLARCDATDALKREEELEPLKRATDLAQDSEAAWFYFGLALNQCGRYEDALRCFEYVIKALNPENHWAWYAKGLTLDDMNDSESAVGCYAEAMRLDPEVEAATSCDAVRLNRSRWSSGRPGLWR